MSVLIYLHQLFACQHTQELNSKITQLGSLKNWPQKIKELRNQLQNSLEWSLCSYSLHKEIR